MSANTPVAGADSAATFRHLYVHVPFCARRCSYCDFAIAVRAVVPTETYVDAIRQELQRRLPLTSRLPLDTVYLGGGTPSRLGPQGIGDLMGVIRSELPIHGDAEITMEANPEDITADAVRAWHDAGINRLSIGIQSFDNNVLRWMHRVHDAESALRSVAIARDGGIAAFSVDLIFAVPTNLQRDWGRDLDMALALRPDHVSLYGLTIEPHTPLGRWQARGDVEESPEERYEAEFLRANGQLGAAGFEHYEVSNFARPGRRAIHNSAYWRNVPYLGIGPSAHGFDGRERRWNEAAYVAWQQSVASGNDPVAGSEVLTPENRVAEMVYLGLRTRDGLELSETELDRVSSWFTAGWLEWVSHPDLRRVRCTPLGWLRLDRLATDLTALRSHS